MKEVSAAFLWHMHQPLYRDPLTGGCSLPWVRLHCIRGYYDMLSVLKDYPDVKATFNFVPSLISQIREYSEKGMSDDFFELSSRPAKDLTRDERLFVLRYFFMCNWDRMIYPRKRYYHLLKKRGIKVDRGLLESAETDFSVEDMRDLQVWFNLAWFGFTALKENGGLGELVVKGEKFSEVDKEYVMKAQLGVMAKVIPLARELKDGGQIEISCSPFFHPILPLLVDTDSTLVAMPGAPLPPRFRAPEDAAGQIRLGMKYHEQVFGSAPLGMWPSEGSVSPDVVGIAADAGIKWMATDEDILFRSIGGGDRNRTLYRAYRAVQGDRGVDMVFRDRAISDAIGFAYSRNDAKVAVDDIMGRFNAIRAGLSGHKGPFIIPVILDGENPWESYDGSGEEFLRRLYQRLSNDRTIGTVKIGEFTENCGEKPLIKNLFTGSWINHNFDIWIGSAEENRAWQYLGEARSYMAERLKSGPSIAQADRESAQMAIYAAEGSDWFWWFGDDFTSENDEEFDRLFRNHLRNFYMRLGGEPPEYLNEPVSHIHDVKPPRMPRALLSPSIDGSETNYFEWQEAGYAEIGPGEGAMYRQQYFFKRIFFGFDLERFFVRMDPRPLTKFDGQVSLNFHFETGGRKFKLSFPLAPCRKGEGRMELIETEDWHKVIGKRELNELAIGKIVEFALPFSALHIGAGGEFTMSAHVMKGQLEMSHYPRMGGLSLRAPTKDFEQEMWSV